MTKSQHSLILSDNLFDRLISNFGSLSDSVGISNFIPLVNTREGDYAYHIEVDLPGIKKEEVNIDLKNGALLISGERKYRNELKQEDYYKLESAHGKFQRIFNLPKDIDQENIEAKYSDGVLEVVIPKLSKEQETKKITIK